jgi:hypothetical protein
VDIRLFYRLHSRSAPLDFTHHWDYLRDYLAGADSEKKVASPIS